MLPIETKSFSLFARKLPVYKVLFPERVTAGQRKLTKYFKPRSQINFFILNIKVNPSKGEEFAFSFKNLKLQIYFFYQHI